MNEPRVVVIPRVRFRGWNGDMPPNVSEAPVLPISEALARRYTADACILCYAPRDPSVDRHPRLNKPSLAFYELEGEETPQLEVAFVDIDYEDHASPPDGWAESILARSPWPASWYRTPSGLRLIYVPREPVPIEFADSYIAQLHEQLDAAGIPTDRTTRDWTRLFKAPHCVGREFPFDYSHLGDRIPWHPETLARAEALALGPIVERHFETAMDTIPEKWTWADLEPLGRKSKLAKAIKDDNLAAPVGQRHATLLGAVRDIVRAWDTNDPMVPFHLLATAAVRLEKPVDELWRLCEWACAQRSGTAIARGEQRDEAFENLQADLDVSEGEAMNRVVIDTGREYYVWDEERGEYSTGYSTHTQLLGALARHAPSLAEGYYEGKGASASVIMRDLATVADKVVLTYLSEPTGYDRSTYTFYQRVARPDRSLVAEFSSDVDTWLRLLAGDGEGAAHLLDWLAAYPDLSRPVCAMYLHSDPSVGKAMLAMGLARLHSAECTVTPYEQLLGPFNPTLKQSPLIYADERVPQDAFTDNDSSVFRRIIGNGSILIRDLNRAHAKLVGYPRVLITANNDDALVIREDLTPEDVEAVRIRIGYIDSRSDEEIHPAAQFLADYAAREGFESARDATESWVAGGVIARHVLWLEENREYGRGDRFLVEGWESALTRGLSTSAGATGAVAEFVAQVIDGREQALPLEGIRWFGGHVFVNNQSLGEEWAKRHRLGADKPPRSTSRMKALKAMSAGRSVRLDVPDASNNGRRQLSYWAIPAETIARLAEDRGICPASEITNAANREAEPSPVRVAISAMGGKA